MEPILAEEPKQLVRSTSLLSSARHHTSTLESWRPPSSRDSIASSCRPMNDTQGRMRKRHSFFARSQSDTPKLRRTPSTLTRSPPPSDFHQEHWSRPGTAQSVSSRTSRRKGTDPLVSIRNSLFGGRRKARSKEDSASSSASGAGSSATNADGDNFKTMFKTEEDCECEPQKPENRLTNSGIDYRHLRKCSISPPFNFEHITHTGRRHLPRLETVNEKDLKAEFWGVSAYQRPKHFLNGIQAEDLSTKLPLMGVERNSPSSRPTSPVPAGMMEQTALLPDSPKRRFFGSIDGPKASINETIFDEVRETKFDPDVAMQTLRVGKPQQFPLPKRCSSMGAIRESRESSGPSDWPLSPASLMKHNGESYVQLPAPPTGTFHESEHNGNDAPSDRPIPRRETPIFMSPSQPSTPCSDTGGDGAQQSDASIEDTASTQCAQHNITPSQSPGIVGSDATCSRVEHSDRAQQPLPPVPTQQRPASIRDRSASQNSIFMSKSEAPSTLSLLTSDRPSTQSKSSKSTTKSPATESNPTSTSSIPTRSSILSEDLTWEDEVDFLYEQNAESTCNFDWQHGPIESTLERDFMDLRLSSWATSTQPFNTPTSASKSSADARVASSPWHEGNAHSRGSSVGHRGFLAARRGSKSKSGLSDGLHKQLNAPAPLDITQMPPLDVTPTTSPIIKVLSPVLSVREDEDSAEPAPKLHFSPNTLHFHSFDSTNRCSAEYVSEPESSGTRRSKHSKSSSYSSYDSVTRCTPTSGSRETARWSSASSASNPELMHSHKRRSKASLHKVLISRPLECLPQSPGSPFDTENPIAGDDSSIVPRALQVEPMRNTFIVARPASASDHRLLQHAGRAVQTGRPSTLGRLGLFPRIQSAEEQEQKYRRAASAEPWVGWV